jgi:hypothetical protein
MAPGIVVLLGLLAVSCASIGPKTIPRDQFDYGKAIADSGREQILSNIVGLRYVEAPLFVNVSSVINQYALEGEVAVGGGVNTSVQDGNTLTLGGAGRWSDRPTITYAPVSGREFATSLLTPLPPESLFALVQAGWPAELILRMTVRSINGIENEWAGPALRRQADPRFAELLRVWSRLRNAGVLGLRRQDEEGGPTIIVYLTEHEDVGALEPDLAFLFETLQLAPGTTEARLRYGLIPSEPNEITVLTASILELMNEMAWRIDVPPAHVEEGRTISTFVSDDASVPPLIRVHHAEERPDQALVAVRDRGYWFYIDDRDVISKRTFAMVQILISLTDSGDTARGPVVSLTN